MSSTLPVFLEDSIRSIASNNGFPDTLDMEVIRMDNNSDVLSSAYVVIIRCDEDRMLKLYVKCMEDKDGRFLEEGRVFFQNEVVFYGGLMESFNELVKIPQAMIKPSPTCYSSHISPDLSFLIFEHLSPTYLPLNFTPTLQETFQILDSLAKLHSVSLILKSQFPLRFHAIVDQITEPLFNDEISGTFGKLFVSAIHDALKLAKASLPKGSLYVDKLADLTLNVFDKMIEMAQEGDEEFKVVSHGDLRTGNVLMKYDEDGNPNHGCLLDFQACRYSSPSHDLSFFLLVSLPQSIRSAHLPTLLRRYHSTLCTCISQSGSDPLLLFPMSALRSELTKHARFAVALSLAGLPLYLDEGGGSTNHRSTDSGSGESCSGESCDSSGEDFGRDELVEAVKEVTGRKSMKCKNKIMEVLIDAVDLGWL